MSKLPQANHGVDSDLYEDINQIRGTYIVQSSDDAIQKAYLDYSTYTLLERVLPNLNDGLKPIAKRLILSMKNRQMVSGKQLKKSVVATSECLSSYHPHGDLATYEALVFMSQGWKRPYPLVHLEGNNGNISGDSYAASRYTEVCLSKITMDTCLGELSEAVIPHSYNYNNTLQVPNYLPISFPNLLINGNDGIGIGLISAIPSHNMKEVIDSVSYLINNPECSDEDIMSFIKGPDFPSGCSILNAHEAQDIYTRGNGAFIMQSEYEINKNKITITEIPYQSNIAGIVSKITRLTKELKLPVSRIINKTDRTTKANKTDLEITVSQGADANQIMQIFLSSDTGLRRSIKHDFTVYDAGVVYYRIPVVQYLRNFVKIRKTIKTRYYQDLARKDMTQLDLLRAIVKVLPNIDRVIQIIRHSEDDVTAIAMLVEEFSIHNKQAIRIVEMQLKKLTSMGISATTDEISRLEERVNEYVSILQNPEYIDDIILNELETIQSKYGRPRCTRLLTIANSSSNKKSVRGIGNTVNVLSTEEVADCIITLTQKFIRRIDADDYRITRKGAAGRNLKFTKDDKPLAIVGAQTNDILWCLTSLGRIIEFPAGSIKEVKPDVLGTSVNTYFKLQPDEHVVDLKVLPMYDGKLDADYIVTSSKRGMIKKVLLDEYKNIGPAGIKAMGIKEHDEALGFIFASSDEYLMTVSKYNRCCAFAMEEVSQSLRPAYGIIHQSLGASKQGEPDELLNIFVVNDNTAGILTIDAKGFGKLTDVEQYMLRTRGSLGYYTIDNPSKEETNTVAMCEAITNVDSESVFLVTEQSKSARLEAAQIQTFKRQTKGVRIMKIQPDDNIVSGILIK